MGYLIKIIVLVSRLLTQIPMAINLQLEKSVFLFVPILNFYSLNFYILIYIETDFIAIFISENNYLCFS